MAAAGKYGYYLGEVTLDIEDKRIINKKATLYPVTQLPKVETNFEEEGRLLLSDPVVDLLTNMLIV